MRCTGYKIGKIKNQGIKGIDKNPDLWYDDSS